MIGKQFAKNVLPSMLAFAFSGVYAIVDGWFVGRNIGDTGLAAINVAYPLVALLQAAGTGLGMGGAIQIAIFRGSKEEEKERKYLGNLFLILAGVCVLLTVLLQLIYVPVLQMFGADGVLLEYASQYLRVIIFGAGFQILGTGLIPVVRNYEGALVAMTAMILGFCTNVVLDWLFVSVYPYGMAGAAIATIIGQAVTVIPCLVFLTVKKIWRKARWKLNGGIIGKIGKVALSPFGLTLSPNIVIVILNKGASVYGGDEAVACYAVVSYVVCVIQLLLQGIGDGSQPLVSLYHGAGNQKAVKSVRKLAYLYAGITAVCSMAVIGALRHQIPGFFGASAEVGGTVAATLLIFISAFLFAAFLRVTTAYFYAVKKNREAYLLIYGEPVVLALLTAFVLPRLFGLNGVWFGVLASQGILSVVGVYLLWKEKNGR